MFDISEILYRLKTLPPVTRIILFSVAGLLVFGLVFWSMSDVFFPPAPKAPTAHQGNGTAMPATQATVKQVSPWLFGTNLGLFDDHDQVLTSAATRGVLQQLHAQIIRMPVRATLSEATEKQAVQTIKDLGAVPMIVLLAGTDANTLSFNKLIINDVNTIFGTSTVYYEYGNEEDMRGTPANTYTSSWNMVIPQMKQLAPQAQFVGPAMYHYDATYLNAFLQGAQPRPDEVSWHEYTCVGTDTNDTCLAHINDWSTHINGARTAMAGIVGRALPIIISEWNYAADAISTSGTMDPRSQDSNFLTTWTQRAIQTLAVNQVFASMQYFCTSSVPLVANDNTIAPQGQVFQTLYNQYATNNQLVTPSVTQQPTALPQNQATANPGATATTANPGATATTANPGATTTAANPGATATTQVPTGTTPTAGAVPTTAATQTTPTAASGLDPQTLYTTVTSVQPAYMASLSNQDGARWDVGLFTGGGTCSFAGGAYRIMVPQKNSAGICVANGTSINDFAFQVQMTITTGDGGGLVFRDTGQQLYRFYVSSNGTYNLANMTQVLTTGTSQAIKAGSNQSNEVTVIAKGQQIYLFVNKQYLTTVTDGSSIGGKLGLFSAALANPTTVTFSVMRVWAL
ncbi:MAG TPA: hypothetical protein VKR06_25985 [Ktedonosporobacter sp.]|nr:hypothetical protein [Ktedonosporobacter sp.]